MALRLALLGAQEPLGEAVASALEESGLDIAVLAPLACEDSDAMLSFAGEDLPVVEAADFDWTGVDVLIAVEAHGDAARHVAAAQAAGCAVLQGGLPGAAAPAGATRIPSGLTLAATQALAPLRGDFGLESLDLMACLPVSLAGRAGVEELARQTGDVFAMREPETEVYPVRMAFNLIPQVGAPLPDGGTRFETACADDLRAELAAGDLPIMVTATWAPLFHGVAVGVHGRCARPLDLAALRACCAGNPRVTVMDEAVPGGAPTPCTDAQESDGVFVGRLRVDARDSHRFALWLVCDAARLEAARIVALLENMIEKSPK